MSGERVTMPSALRSAVMRQASAGEARDRNMLLLASMDLADSGFRLRASMRVRGALLTDRVIGSLILVGRGPSVADQLLRQASRQTRDGEEVPLARIPEDDWHAAEMGLLRETRLLAGDWRPIPSKHLRSGMLGAGQKRELRQFNALAGAFARRDGAAIARAIAVIGRNEPASFSVLAYALYQQARGVGLSLKVPRKYDF